MPTDAKIDNRRWSELDAESKVNQRKSLRTSLLTAKERAELVERSLEEGRRRRSEKESVADMTSKMALLQREAELLANGYTYQPPLEGCVRGEEWNKYVDALWSEQKRTVIHTIILPPGRNPKDLTFYKAKLLSKTRHIMERDQIPTTVSAPKNVFECFIDPDCTKLESLKTVTVPNHFLVVDAKLPPKTMKVARQITAELEEKQQLPHQQRSASMKSVESPKA
eukprot:Blabericola_migrator_1__3083@NODE_189_length_11671_cov_137_497242_g164_i0_p8_GENE_NODE_189_length_11671_cov_137_497242_g164_i0NODE_189_length_11671_cov_137_497242_g164_i0_p8_ORF_typecomplete_len224_score38_29_NODE_189_length_11671_cov_137_497242_g164_i0936810039